VREERAVQRRRRERGAQALAAGRREELENERRVDWPLAAVASATAVAALLFSAGIAPTA
jgi:hypothetical protein